MFSFRQQFLLTVLLASASVGCAVSAQTGTQNGNVRPATIVQSTPTAPAAGQTQALAAQSPSNTVREFYRALRERRFREAMLATNLRPAVETLTAKELEELRSDFEPLAVQTPANIDISGEQISGDLASVLVKIPGSSSSKAGIDEIGLRRENNRWVILSADAEAEALARRIGKEYFFKLRIDNYHSNVGEVIQEIVKAQLAYSLLNNGVFADLPALVRENLLPAEILKNDYLGYKYGLTLLSNGKNYVINAEPVEYGRTGKLSFVLDSAATKTGGKIQSEDNKGRPLAAKK